MPAPLSRPVKLPRHTMPSETKQRIVALILEKLREEFDARLAASRQTRAEGNDEESKAEGKYDTRSIEENYLADGLAQQAQAAALAAAEFEKVPLEDLPPGSLADVGALVEIEFPDGVEWFFIGPAGGGTEITLDGRTITVVTPESPLGAKILDRRAGDDIPGVKLRSVT